MSQTPLSHCSGSFEFQVREIAYAKPDGEMLRALIYRPLREGPFPAVVCVHGGAWVTGDRFATQGFAERIARTGIAVMAIDTRLAPRYPYPAAVADVNCAIRWLKWHAEEYGVDKQRIGGLGISSGGCLVLLSAMRFDDPRYKTEQPLDLPAESKVDAEMAFVVTCSGVLDPLARYRMAQDTRNMAVLLCHRAFFVNETVMEEASPAAILSRREKVNLPPALFLQGKNDPRLPAGTAPEMAVTWKRAGGQAEAVIYPEAGHSVSTWHKKELMDALFRIAALATGEDSQRPLRQ